MPLLYDITGDYLYLLGEERGKSKGKEEWEKKGLEKGLQKGLQKGVQKEKIETVMRCFENGMSIEQTAVIVGLSIDEVQKIKDKIT